METILELLKRIKCYSEWDDRDDRLDLVICLDEIHEMAIDAIQILLDNPSN